jgi:hypothetical protein
LFRSLKRFGRPFSPVKGEDRLTSITL